LNTPDSATVMIMAGGTGGHIFPGLAVAQALRTRGIGVIWLGSEGGMETRLVAANNFSIETLAIKGLRGKNIKTLLQAPWRISKAIWSARALMKKYQPAAVVSFGGYTAGPGGVAAWLAGRPLLVHEQNRAPGMTNRLLARIADKVMTGFPDSFPQVPHTTVGNPVRSEISALPAPEARARAADAPMRVLILGGSQGARALNALLPRVFAGLSGLALSIRHQCGEKLSAEAEQCYREQAVQARIEPFISDMAEAYAWADVVIGRAGALTVAEICAAGVASILIPLPTAVDDHQAKNADFLKQHGAGFWFRQTDELAGQLGRTLAQLAHDPALRMAMAKAARSVAFPRAAEDVADLIQQEMAA
jgi:UDP-N-acetylglucosamine--N-acetylmuramyl-(pentapeptide) pyrophosphoryl-undecaprenol N-acetylglucosamine transferase